jgi:hypothetical protein
MPIVSRWDGIESDDRNKFCEAKHEIHRGRSCKMHLQPTVANLRAQDHPSSLKHSQRQNFLRQEAHKSVRISAKKRHYIALAEEYYRA